MNLGAFEAAFLERGLPVPPGGPREGAWGARLGNQAVHPRLNWIARAASQPPLFEIDADGCQHWRAKGGPRLRIMIFGGSVAFGGGASEIDKTYFAVMGRALEKSGIPAEIAICAAGAWKSKQDTEALDVFAAKFRPDLAIFLNGLNDLTNGAFAGTLHGEPATTLDGSAWTKDYHAHDYDARVAMYLANMEWGAGIAGQKGVKTLIVLQPALFEKTPLSRTEKELARNAVGVYKGEKDFPRCYEAMRQGLIRLERHGMGKFMDASRIFDGEKETTFMDLWHFPDPGHEILGEAMAQAVAEMESRGEPKVSAHP